MRVNSFVDIWFIEIEYTRTHNEMRFVLIKAVDFMDFACGTNDSMITFRLCIFLQLTYKYSFIILHHRKNNPQAVQATQRKKNTAD